MPKTEDWEHSLCGVCCDCSGSACPCCITYAASIVPCVIYGQTHALIKNGDFCGPCCFYFTMYFIGLTCCVAVVNRYRVGLANDIYHSVDCGTCCCLCFVTCFCSPCNLAQVYLQVSHSPSKMAGGHCTGIFDAPHSYNKMPTDAAPAPTTNVEDDDKRNN
jgi:hypothetical protein